MSSIEMKYNTEDAPLTYKEYGRNIQELVEYALQIEDRAYRTKFSTAIVALMGQMHPHLKNVEEFKHKLWDQLYHVSNFRLDIDAPYPKPSREDVLQKPANLPYPQNKLRFKHYGKNVESLVIKAMTMEAGPKRRTFAKVIANYMKMVYSNRNKEIMSDEIIINDLKILSKNILDLSDEPSLELPKSTPIKKKKRSQSSSSKYSKSGHYGNNSNYSGYNQYGSSRSNSYPKRRYK